MSARIQVSIGRNVGGEPMSDNAWKNFQSDVTVLLEETTTRKPENKIVEGHEGDGFWVDEAAGITYKERSFHATAIGVLTHDAVALVERLEDLAVSYNQDAIALDVSYTSLIGRVNLKPQDEMASA